MAVPVLLGLPWLATAIASIFTSTVAFLATYLTKRLALIAAAIIALVAFTTGFITLIEGLAAGLSLAVPFGSIVGLFVPDEYSTLLGIYLSARLAQWVYWWNVRAVQLKLF